MVQVLIKAERQIKQEEYTSYFSVIIPTLNEESKIERLLKSLKRQTFKDFEVIIVDGGSRDQTVEIAEKFSAKVYVKKGLKEFPSRNYGAKVSKGKILLFLSADVLLPSDALEYLKIFFDKGYDGICAMGMPFEAPLWMKLGYLAHWKILRLWMALSKDYHGSTNFMAVRKKDFFRIGGFEDKFCADTLFFNALGRKRKVKILNRICVFVSGRRAEKMGFFRFYTHFLWVIVYDYFPFLRNTAITRFLQNYSSGYRAKHG
ncbi:MAG: glycosyltransferase [Candidatus Bathyarchaeia archaeon]